MKNFINVEFIKNFLKENKLSKDEFCKKCNISTSTFDKVLNGECCILGTLMKLSKAMDVKLYELFNLIKIF